MMNQNVAGANELDKYRDSVRKATELFKQLSEMQQHEVMGIMVGMNLVRNQSGKQT